MAEEQRFSDRSKCSHCGNNVLMEIVAEYSQVKEAAFGHITWYVGPIHEMLKCPACDAISLRRYLYHEDFVEDGFAREELYPIPARLPMGMPNDVEAAYNSAQAVRTIEANAYGVLVRRLLEIICIEQKAKGHSLHDQLESLAREGVIPKNLIGVANGLRVLGNIGAHAAGGTLTGKEVPLLESLVRAVIEYVYTAPHLAAEAESLLAAFKRE